MILKRLLSPLPHPSSHLPYGAASCPLFIFAVRFEWQGDKQGWWRVLFAAVGLIDRWGVGSARCVTPFKLDEKQYVNFTHTIPVRLWPTAEMTPWIPEAVWPLVMKSLLFFMLLMLAPSCRKRWCFMICSDLCYHPCRFSILNDSAGTQCIVLLPILFIQWTPAACDWFSDQLQH